jgi:phage virion morphogenesis protein
MAIEQRIKYDDAVVQAALERLARALPLGGDMTPAMREVGRIVKTETQQRFRDEESPEGVPWIPSVRALIEGGQTLTLTARLRRSITYQADHVSVEVGTNVVYGAVHQFGRSRTTSIFEGLKRGLGAAAARSKGLPARPYLGVSDAGRLQLVEAVNGFLGRTWAGR